MQCNEQCEKNSQLNKTEDKKNIIMVIVKQCELRVNMRIILQSTTDIIVALLPFSLMHSPATYYIHMTQYT